MKRIYALLLVFLLLSQTVLAGTETRTYEIPDVRDAFCGVEMNFQYCQCAFHNNYCDAVFMDSSEAWNYVLSEFRSWNRENIQAMGETCLNSGGHWNKNTWTCTTCTDGDVLSGAQCVPASAEHQQAIEECREAEERFAEDWEQFSDFDTAIPVSDASFEVQQYNETIEEITRLTNERIRLVAELSAEQEYQNDLREYKGALVENIKTNLLKAFWRLSYVTFKTLEGGRGGAETFSKAIRPSSVSEGLGAGLKTIQAHIPAHEKSLQFNTASTAGQVGSILWNGTIEALESVGNPQAVGTQFIKDVRGAAIGGPDISDEEIAILRTQHLENQAVEEAIAGSASRITEIRARVFTIEAQVAELYNEAQEWKAREYQRVQLGLLEQCSAYE
jgi:hypothetical protein